MQLSERDLNTDNDSTNDYVLINTDNTACSGSLFVTSDFTISDPDLTDSLTPARLSSKRYQPIVTGQGTLTLGAPNASGPLNIGLDVPSWLEFDFNGDTTPTDVQYFNCSLL